MKTKEQFITDFYSLEGKEKEELIANIRWAEDWKHYIKPIEREVEEVIIKGYQAEFAIENWLKWRKKETGLDYQFDALNKWHFEKQDAWIDRSLDQCDIIITNEDGSKTNVEIKHCTRDLYDIDGKLFTDWLHIYRPIKKHVNTDLFFIVDKNNEWFYSIDKDSNIRALNSLNVEKM